MKKQIDILIVKMRVGRQFPLTVFHYIWPNMIVTKPSGLFMENESLESYNLERQVKLDFYLPTNVQYPGEISLLLINDGQNLQELGLAEMLEKMYRQNTIRPLLCAGIHAGPDRKTEYGTARRTDYKGRGAKAYHYTKFVMEELIPFISLKYQIPTFRNKSFAGFSLGGLSALDIVWNHPGEFSNAGVFSGSLWWRTKGLDAGYIEETDRIMHARIREGVFHPGMKFFFETGTLDEVMDRNNNGIIDSIDDTISLIEELEEKGYQRGRDIMYLELADGKHDIATWARAMPAYLKWAHGMENDA